jgi:hypothetical protein
MPTTKKSEGSYAYILSFNSRLYPKPSLSYKPHDQNMFRLTITWASCVTVPKAQEWGTF